MLIRLRGGAGWSAPLLFANQQRQVFLRQGPNVYLIVSEEKTTTRFIYTVKPVLSGHLKIDITKVLMENGSLMKVKSIAECSPCIKQ